MLSSLAIVAPSIGVISETFIRRHMVDIYPGRTVVVGHFADPTNSGKWSVPGPNLVLDADPLRWGMFRARRAVHLKFGWRPPEQIDLARSFLKHNNVTVMMTEYLNLSVSVVRLAKELGISMFAHAHGYDVSRLLRDPEWVRKYQELNETDGVITFSQAGRDRLIGIGLDPSRVHVIPYGVSVPDHPQLRQCNKIVRCLAVGRMVGKKAPILTLDAFRRALEHSPNLCLDYIGDGDLMPAARQFVRAFGLEDRITFHGSQPRDVVQEYMARADIFLQHSIVDPDTGDEEGMPVSVLEAMSAALPVVSTFHAGIPEAVEDGVCGYLVKEGDSISMSERIVALAQNADCRSKIGQAAWGIAREKFTWEKERDSLKSLLRLDTET